MTNPNLDPTFTNTPPDDATLIPVTAFKAFHNNFTGIPRTGEMKLSINIPVDDIHAALDIAEARDEILWVQVSKLRFGGENIAQLADKIREQTEERERLRSGGTSTSEPKRKRVIRQQQPSPQSPRSELDWET